MSWIAKQPDTRLIQSSCLPGSLQQVLSFIKSSRAVVAGSVQCYESDEDDRRYIICLQFIWDIPAQIVETKIQRPESIAFWFPANPGFCTAPKVRADRDDFPLDLPHLNCIKRNTPAWFCLAREALDTFYIRRGIQGILERLNQWLRDAAAGELDHDGWEPTPRLHGFSATLDIAAFQKIALNSKSDKPGNAMGFTLAVFDQKDDEELEYHYKLFAKQKKLEEIKNLSEQENIKGRIKAETAWISVWGPRNSPINDRFWEIVLNYDSLIRYAENAGCKKLVEDAITLFSQFAEKFDIPAFVLLIGTWRPKPLINSIPGLASGNAANLEIAGFHVGFEKDNTGKSKVRHISELRILSEMNANCLNKLAGYSSEPRDIVLIGLGALGSKIAEHIVREGVPSIGIVDNDYFLPHNLSRHNLTDESVYFPKATELQKRLLSINPLCEVKPFSRDIVNVPAGYLVKDICNISKGMIIDATADVSVMRRLCAPDNKVRTAKIELAYGGCLGLLYYEGKNRRPRVDDLKAIIPVLGVDIPEVYLWLSDKDEGRVETGIGCASASMQISDSRISLHAGNFMTSLGNIIRPEYHPSGIGIAILDQRGYFSKWLWIEEKAPEIITKKIDSQSWEIRIRKKALEIIDESRNKTNPVECGGYLYGSYDLVLRTIYITVAIAVSPRDASAIRVRLPSAGKSNEEIELRKFSGEQIRLLGTWHTHPQGSPKPSPIDIEQFKQDAAAYAELPSPHVMLIRSNSDLTATLALPSEWSD